MSKSILDKSGHYQNGKSFISPSIHTDKATPEQSSGFQFGWKQAAGALAGAYLLRKFPKTAILSIFTLGVAAGVAMVKKENDAVKKAAGPFNGEGLADLSHH